MVEDPVLFKQIPYWNLHVAGPRIKLCGNISSKQNLPHMWKLRISGLG